ncbi:cell division protein PerM [Agromyces sp. CCNWLW203]|uniref:cell division protein PerM n=1 Tax=Agromyces sp. CCNWLW203 TaxID=3112842 RepID=UPI002F964E39
MRRTTIALLAGLEASVAALIGLGIALVPLMLLWAVHFGLAVDAALFLRAAADVWLLGHGVDLVVQLDAVTAEQTGLPGAGDPFPITIALLGFALISVAFARRIGRRSAAEGHSFTGGVSAVAVYAVVGFVLATAAGVDGARSSLWQAALLPALTMAVGVVIGAVTESLRDDPMTDAAGGLVRRRVAELPPALVDGVRIAVRIGAGAAFGLLAVAGVLVAVLITIDYATIAGLYQSLGSGIDGGIALTVAELSLIPNVVIWGAAWLLGPGFAIGAGSSVAPSGTLIGPMPGLPLLGALPNEAQPFGALWLVVPVLLGFVGAWLVAPSVPSEWSPHGERDVRGAWWFPAVIGVGSGAVAGLVLGLLAWWSGGAVGPGRLAEVGPDPWAVAGVAALVVGVGAIAGAYSVRARGRSDGGHEASARSSFDRGFERGIDEEPPPFDPNTTEVLGR